MKHWTIIIFGMSGDLAKRKLLPALYTLFATNKNKDTFTIIGTSQEETTKEAILADALPFIEKVDQKTLEDFMAICFYFHLDSNNPQSFKDFAQKVKQHERNSQTDYRCAYLAIPADCFCTITHGLHATQLIEKGNPLHCVVYEKPFGLDYTSGQGIHQCITQALDTSQVYRIDHYLTKSLISNIILMRFSNIIFEPVWNHKYIQHIQIILNESLGIEGRVEYYDRYGSLKDVVQNHMLQMLALIAMEQPEINNEMSIQQKKYDVLKNIIVDDGILGQYEGYQKEIVAHPDSTTETFAALKLSINQPRWQGVPFYLRTGKYLDKKLTEIIITFKTINHCFIKATNHCSPNVLTINIAPDEGYHLRLNAKKPHTNDEITTTSMDFCYSCLFSTETTQAYVILLQDVFSGDRSISVSAEEIEQQWAIIDMIKQRNFTLYPYKKGSEGPEQVKQFLPDTTLSDKDTI